MEFYTQRRRPKRKVVGVVSITPFTKDAHYTGMVQYWLCCVEVEEEPVYNKQPLTRMRTVTVKGIDEMDVMKRLLTEGA